MQLKIDFVIIGDPVVKKNGRSIFRSKNGKVFLGKTQRIIDAEKSAHIQLLAQKKEMITEDVAVAFKIFTRTKRRMDLSNAVQLYEDALERSGIIENDNQIRSLDGTRQLCDPKNPRVEIVITNFVQ